MPPKLADVRLGDQVTKWTSDEEIFLPSVLLANHASASLHVLGSTLRILPESPRHGHRNAPDFFNNPSVPRFTSSFAGPARGPQADSGPDHSLHMLNVYSIRKGGKIAKKRKNICGHRFAEV